MSGDQGWMDGMNERVRVQVGVAGRGGSLSPFGSFVFVSLWHLLHVLCENLKRGGFNVLDEHVHVSAPCPRSLHAVELYLCTGCVCANRPFLCYDYFNKRYIKGKECCRVHRWRRDEQGSVQAATVNAGQASLKRQQILLQRIRLKGHLAFFVSFSSF